ncbi:MAG: DUF6067 family protein [Rikenellaceae bacterium]
MKKILLTASLLVSTQLIAQTTQWGESTGNERFPKEFYQELENPNKPNPTEWAKVKGVKASWANNDDRYSKEVLPAIKTIKTKESLVGWKGENVSTQVVVWSKERVENLNFTISTLKGSNGEIEAQASFVRYVMSDMLAGCGKRSEDELESYSPSLIADVIDPFAKELEMDEMSVRPIWVSVKLPYSAQAGNYKGVLTVKNGDVKIADLELNVKVLNRELTQVADWKFHLDFWQNPFAEARYGGYAPFSPQHLEYMRPQYERLRDAGQKVITTSIMHKPWGGQTEDYFETMITWIRKIDGTWMFDYTIFDTWVEYMIGIGIDKQIACYSMIPWSMSFKYYDQQTNSMQEIKTTTDSKIYREMWVSMLSSLSKHLREKGWFERSVIAMDERATSDMMNAFAIIKEADPEFKVSLAGGNHPEIEDELYDYCMASDNIFTDEVFKKRKEQGRVTTYYTCCAQEYPNMFTFSPAAESDWIGWFAAAKGYDGYLRWAYNSYTLEPLLDTRFRTFQAGDCYLVYPQRSSVRFEKLVDGIESFEKIAQLREEFEKSNNQSGLKKITDVLSTFELQNFKDGITPSEMLIKARKIINSF